MNISTGANPVAGRIRKIASKMATLTGAVKNALAQAVLPHRCHVLVPVRADTRRVGPVRNKT